MSFVSLLGIIAAILTTGAFVPQAYKTIKTRATADLSVSTFSMLFIGTLTWLVYGLYINDLPLVFANGITAILAGIILYIKIRADLQTASQGNGH